MSNKIPASTNQIHTSKKIFLLNAPIKSRNNSNPIYNNLLTEQKPNLTTYDELYFPIQKWHPDSTLSQFQGSNPRMYHHPLKHSKSKNIGYFRNILNFSKNLLISYRDNDNLENRLNQKIKKFSRKTPSLIINLPKLDINSKLQSQFSTTNCNKDSTQEETNKTNETIKNSPRMDMNVFDQYYKNVAVYETTSSFRGCPTNSTCCKTSRNNDTLSIRSKFCFEDSDVKNPLENKRKLKHDLVNNLLFGKNEHKSYHMKSHSIKILSADICYNLRKENNQKENQNILNNFDCPKNGFNYKLPGSYGETKDQIDNEITLLLSKAINEQKKQLSTITKNIANYGNEILDKIKIVNTYLSLQKQSLFIPTQPRHKVVFVILDGTVVLSTKHIPGVYVEIPTRRSLSFLNTKKERLEKYYNFLNECKEKLKLKVCLNSVFLVTSVPIFDLIDIPEQDICVYVSSNSIFHGVHIFNENNNSNSKRQIIDSLNEKEIDLLQFKPASKAHQKKFDLAKFIRKRKKKNHLDSELEKKMKRFKKTKKEKQKYLNEQSFTFKPDDEEEQEEWKYLSDEETRRKKLDLFFYNHYDSKIKFCVYILNSQMNNKISELRKTQRKKINKFMKQHPNENTKIGLGKLISIYNAIRSRRNTTYCTNNLNLKKNENTGEESNQEAKEIHGNATQVMKLFIEKMKIFRTHEKAKIHFNTNLFYQNTKPINDKNKYVISNQRETVDMVYHSEHKTERFYPDLISYHIPNLLLQFPKLKRREVYEVFAEFKTLLKICISINKNLSLIKEGIDFETFFNCNLQINSQGKALAKKIFNAVNTLNSKYINWDEYMKGLLTLRNKDLNDKLDLFLNIIDEDGNGNLSFEEVYSLSLESLSRNLQKNETEENDIVKILADFFARLIFELVGKPITEEIPIDVIKKKICEGGKAAEYLEMFICADNFT
jgi:hypothetical protein